MKVATKTLLTPKKIPHTTVNSKTKICFSGRCGSDGSGGIGGGTGPCNTARP